MTAPLVTRPARDPRIQPYINNSMIMLSLGLFAGGYAGYGANPRPMTPVDLTGFAQINDRAVAPLRRTIPDTAIFPIWSSRVRTALDKGVAVPPDHLWWFVEPGDTVLLSDRVTHHFTTAGHLDREGDTISFADPWPDDFFLREGFNTLGIRAEGTRIPRAAFTKAAVGIATWDRVSLFDAYLEAYPAQAASAEMQCRIGHAILAIGGDQLMPMAAMRFSMAYDLAGRTDDADLALASAVGLYLSATCGFAVMKAAGLDEVAAAMSGLLWGLYQRHTAGNLAARLRPDELTRLAFCVLHNGRNDLAASASTRAIEMDPAFEDGYWLRATARCRQGRPAEALADVAAFLALNDQAVAALKAHQAAIHPMDSIAGSEVGAALATRLHRRQTVLELAVTAATHAENREAAEAYRRLLETANGS